MATTYIEIGGRLYADLSGGATDKGPFVPAEYIIDPVTGLPASLGGGGSGGDASAANQTSQITQETLAAAALGVPSGAAVITDANGTVQQYLRGLVTRWVNALGAGTAAAALRVAFASDTSLPGSAVAHDAADAGNPHKIGGKAVSALSGLTLPAAADRVDASFDIDGALIVRVGGAIGDRISGTASNTDGASTACIAAQATGIKVNLTDVTLVNMHATSTIYVEIKDGSTVKWVFPVPALGGVTHRFETPITGSAATAWNFDPSAATTTIYCSMAGRLSKV